MVITENKRASFDYEILQTFEAGIVLSGPEVKSVKKGMVNLAGSYVHIDNQGLVWLTNMHIAPYPPAINAQQNYNPTRPRKLLLKKNEITNLIGKSKIKGLTIIPLKVYNKSGIIKVEIGLAKGKKKWDKREIIKKRETERKVRQFLKR